MEEGPLNVNRALPGAMIDLIRDGVPPRDLAARGDRAVWTALVKTAASASLRGHDQWEWVDLLQQPKSRLGAQARLQKDRRVRSPLALATYLDEAWETATAWASEQPSQRTWRVDLLNAENLRDLLADPATPIADDERAVLAFAASESLRRESVTPILARRQVATGTGLTERRARTVLDRLTDAGVLRVAQRGRPGAPGSGLARVTTYRLPDEPTLRAYLYRETRSMGRGAQVYGTPLAPVPMGRTQVYGTWVNEAETTVVLRAADPAALEAAVRAATEFAAVQVVRPRPVLPRVPERAEVAP